MPARSSSSLKGIPQTCGKRLDAAVKILGLTALAVDKLPEVKTHELAVPRIAILHTWTNTQNDGWYRIEFDRYQIPYSYISDQVVRNTPNLREKFDVIIFPPLGGSAQAIVNGIPMRGDPIPWKGSELTPNMGTSPDQSDDIRGGMGLPGVANLQKFVRDGGLFITVANTTQLPIEYGLTTGVSIQETRLLQARGSIFNARFTDRKSPIAYGYDETLPIYFNQAPVFQVAAGGGGGGGWRRWRRWRRRWRRQQADGTRYVDRSGHRAGNAAGFAGAKTGRTSGRADRGTASTTRRVLRAAE